MTMSRITTGFCIMLLSAALGRSWGIINAGQRITDYAERIEALAAEAYTWRANLAWRLLTLGERVEAMGTALEAQVSRWGAWARCDMEQVLMRVSAEAA